ncbi:hypothetical protein BGZ51_000672, partial [Haplosporangium sp. Z 767]
MSNDRNQSSDTIQVLSSLPAAVSSVDVADTLVPSSCCSLQTSLVQVRHPVEDETPLLPEEVENEPLMYVAGHVKGHKLDVLIDCGATASFISQEVVKRFRIPTSKKKQPSTVAFANAQPALCTQYCHVRLKLAENYSPVIQFNVNQMKFEAILGKRWLAQTHSQPKIDFAKHTISIAPDVLIQGYPEPSHQPVLSAMQFKRYLNKEQAYLCIVKTTDQTDVDSKLVQSIEVQEVLSKYQDVFPEELPKELPPPRS